VHFADLEIRLHVRQVGLGNALLLELPDGRCGVVDWGTTGDVHHRYLDEIVGKREIAFVAATHGHEDHTAGLPRLFRRYVDPREGRSQIREFWTPLTVEQGHGSITAVAETLAELWSRHPRIDAGRGVTVKTPAVVDGNAPPVLLQTDSYCLLALQPDDVVRSRAAIMAAYAARRSGNRTSAVLLLRLAGGRASILFGGDAEEASWNGAREVVRRWPAAEPGASVTAVSHHGAAAPRGMPAWAIRRWVTGLAVLSTPSADLAHPATSTLDELSRASEQVCCTSLAAVCSERLRGRVMRPGGKVVLEEPCWGDFVVTLRGDGSWETQRGQVGLVQVGCCGAHPSSP